MGLAVVVVGRFMGSQRAAALVVAVEVVTAPAPQVLQVYRAKEIAEVAQVQLLQEAEEVVQRR